MSSSAVGRVSQRPTHTCTECARRKTKCDKNVPCSGCIKRGKSHLCRIEPHISRKEVVKHDVEGRTPEAITNPDFARVALHEQLKLLRTDSDATRARIEYIESLVDTVLNGTDPQAHALPAPSSSHTAFVSQSMNSSYANDAGHNPYDINVASPYGLPAPVSAPAVASSSTAYASRSNGNRYPDSSERGRSGSSQADSKGEEREEVEASIALEFLALGRNRPYGEKDVVADTYPNSGFQRAPNGSSAPIATESRQASPSNHFVPSPTSTFPTIASIEAVAPTRPLSDSLVAFSLDWLGWHHAAVHGPSFKQEAADFWNAGAQRYETHSPAWLALYFAVLTVGVGNLPASHARHLGLQPDKTSEMARNWFQCSLSLLNMFNYLQNHHVNAVQTIAVLVVSAQEFAQSNLIPTLLATGISIAQQLGYHRICSDEEWEQTMHDQPDEARARSLVSRETRKRVFWALAAQDWFSIPFRRTYVVQPVQVTTPLPNNSHDEDLMTGQVTNRPPREYTVASSILLWIQIAKCIQSVFEHIDKHASPSYDFVLETDKQLENVLQTAPAWMRDDGSEVHPSVQWMRNAFEVSSQHKVLTLHRPFLHRAFHDKRYLSSRQRAIKASRTILQAADRAITTPLWTIPYHIVAAGCLVMLDIFQRASKNKTMNKSDESELDQERKEIESAIESLKKIQEQSGIARRGVVLLSNLLSEEERVARSGESSNGSKKRKRDVSDGNADSNDPKRKMALATIATGAADSSPVAQASPSSTTSGTQTYDPRATAEFLAHLGEWDHLFANPAPVQPQGLGDDSGKKRSGQHETSEALEALPWEQPSAMHFYRPSETAPAVGEQSGWGMS